MSQQNNPLHGIKLETIITYLVDKYGWEDMARRIDIRCFKDNPSVKSSLTFLRKTQWARDKVEYLYLRANKLPLPIKPDPTDAPSKSKSKPAKSKPYASNTTGAKPVKLKPSGAKSVDTKPEATNSTTKKLTVEKPTATKEVNAHIWGSKTE